MIITASSSLRSTKNLDIRPAPLAMEIQVEVKEITPAAHPFWKRSGVVGNILGDEEFDY
jgi:hypothetical protein